MLDSLTKLVQGGMALLLALSEPSGQTNKLVQPMAPPPSEAEVSLPAEKPALELPAADRASGQAQQAGEAQPQQAAGAQAIEPAPVHTKARVEVEHELVAPLAEPIRVLVHQGMVFVPRGFHSQDGSYDLIIHFHGAPQAVEPAVEKNGINAVLLTVNLGIGSGGYESRYLDEKALDREILGMEQVLRSKLHGANVHVRRIALTAWSAGYGAVVRGLNYDRVAEKVDAVLLADGMHAAFEQGSHTQASPLHMAPFTRFAQRAVRGEKLMAVTHSDIGTFKYASTTLTANALIASVGAQRVAYDGPSLKHSPAATRADKGDLHVFGYGGDGKEAHCDHLLQIDETLFPLLAARWAEK